MQHIYRIKSSQNWICPKSGAWKVICVGGGASGGFVLIEGCTPIQQPGGTTSFGNLLTASGGKVSPIIAFPQMETGVTDLKSADRKYISCGGFGGWDGINYGGSPAYSVSATNKLGGVFSSSGNGGFLGCAGIGYGAGGGFTAINNDDGFTFYTNENNTTYIHGKARGVPGLCGEMTNGIFDLTASQSVACTVGTSAKPDITETMLNSHIQQISSVYHFSGNQTNNITTLENHITAGTSGIIYLEYLG